MFKTNYAYILSFSRYINKRIARLKSAVEKVNSKLKLNLEHDCILCDKNTVLPICDNCFIKIKLPEHMCKQCGIALPNSTINNRCVTCIKKPPAHDIVRYLGIYESELRQLILSAKVQKSVAAISALNYLVSNLISERLMFENSIADNSVNDLLHKTGSPHKNIVIIPIPTPTFRIITRGFDFPLLMAKQLHKISKIPLLTNAVSLPFYVKKQSKLKLKKRINNRHKYRLNSKIDYELFDEVIIFDDVITTGNTTNELAKLLKRKGVKHVTIWALARGQLD